MNGLSLFNGMGCFEIALIELGIKLDTIYTSEIDKHALNQTRLNFPNDIELGDVRNIDVSKLKPIHIVVGGSPCQSFSFAGKRKGMATKCSEEIYTLDKYLQLKADGFEFEGQSYLFWEYMRILNDIRKYNPDVLFLLENVEMGNKWERTLSEAIGIFGVHINSALVSAQNRKRIYWTNIRTRENGLFGELHSDIPQPKDKGILLKDILESEVDEKYYLSDKMIDWLDRHGEKRGVEMKKLDGNQKTACLTATAQVKQNLTTDYVCVAMRGRNPDNPSDRTTGAPTEQRLEPNLSGKTNCLTSVQKDNLVMCLTPKRTEYGKQIRKQYEAGEVTAMRKEVSSLEPREDGKTNTLTTVQKDNLLLLGNLTGGKWDNTHEANKRVYSQEGKMCTLQTMGGGNQHPKTMQHSRIRRLTPTECARLQTVPDWYIWQCSDTQQYKMLGNGWTVEVIMHIFSFLPDKYKTP